MIKRRKVCLRQNRLSFRHLFDYKEVSIIFDRFRKTVVLAFQEQKRWL